MISTGHYFPDLLWDLLLELKNVCLCLPQDHLNKHLNVPQDLKRVHLSLPQDLKHIHS